MTDLARKAGGNKVSKANQIVEAKYKLTVREQKLFLYMVSMIEPHDKEFKKYSINIKDLYRIINPKETKWGNIYQDSKDILVNLKRKVLVIKEQEKEHIVNFINDISMVKYSGEIEYQISETLKPYLLQLKKNFTSYKFENVVQLKSTNSIRMYELLKQYEKIGRRIFEIIELKRILGIDKGVYDRYADFKRNVVLRSQEELKAKTDICFTFEEHKSGRKVTKLEFFIVKNESLKVSKVKEKNLQTPALAIPFDGNEELILTPKHKVMDCYETEGISRKDTENLWHRILEERPDLKMSEHEWQKYFLDKLEIYVQQNAKRPIENPVGFLFTALKDDYTYRKPKVTTSNPVQTKKVENSAFQERINKIEKSKKSLKKELFDAQEKICKEILSDDPALLKELMDKVKHSPFVINVHSAEKSLFENYQNDSIRIVIHNELKQLFPEKFEEVKIEFDQKLVELEEEVVEIG